MLYDALCVVDVTGCGGAYGKNHISRLYSISEGNGAIISANDRIYTANVAFETPCSLSYVFAKARSPTDTNATT